MWDAAKSNERSLQLHPSNQTLKASIENLQHQINMLLSQEIACKIKIAKQSFFENANNCLLTNCVKGKLEKNLQLKAQDDSVTANPFQITTLISSQILQKISL